MRAVFTSLAVGAILHAPGRRRGSPSYRSLIGDTRAAIAFVRETVGNRHVTLRTFPGLLHAFNRRVPEVAASAEAARVDPTVAETLARWADTIVVLR